MIADVILFVVLLISVYTDLRFQKIYNGVLFPAALLSLAIHLVNNGLAGLIYSFKGLILGLGLFFIPFILGGLGAGDVKLLALVGVIKGAGFVFTSFLLTAFIGGIIAAVLLLVKGRLFKAIYEIFISMRVLLFSRFTVWNFASLETGEYSLVFPYGVAIALGTILTYWVMI